MKQLFEKEIIRLLIILSTKTELHEISSVIGSIDTLTGAYSNLTYMLKEKP